MEQITDLQKLNDLCKPDSKGYIYNDFSPSETQPGMNVLHSTWCGQLRKKGYEADLSSDKYYAPDVYPLIMWLLAERGAKWKPCGACKLLPTPPSTK